MDPLETFVTDVRGIFGTRLDAVVVYEAVAPAVPEKANNHIQTLTLVDTVKFEDIAGVRRTQRGLGTHRARHAARHGQR